LSAAETDDVERAKRQIRRDLEFIGGVREGALDVKSILSDAGRRIKEAAGAAEEGEG
jgi:hypothetical protein